MVPSWCNKGPSATTCASSHDADTAAVAATVNVHLSTRAAANVGTTCSHPIVLVVVPWPSSGVEEQMLLAVWSMCRVLPVHSDPSCFCTAFAIIIIIIPVIAATVSCESTLFPSCATSLDAHRAALS